MEYEKVRGGGEESDSIIGVHISIVTSRINTEVLVALGLAALEMKAEEFSEIGMITKSKREKLVKSFISFHMTNHEIRSRLRIDYIGEIPIKFEVNPIASKLNSGKRRHDYLINTSVFCGGNELCVDEFLRLAKKQLHKRPTYKHPWLSHT